MCVILDEWLIVFVCFREDSMLRISAASCSHVPWNVIGFFFALEAARVDHIRLTLTPA